MVVSKVQFPYKSVKSKQEITELTLGGYKKRLAQGDLIN